MEKLKRTLLYGFLSIVSLVPAGTLSADASIDEPSFCDESTQTAYYYHRNYDGYHYRYYYYPRYRNYYYHWWHS